MKVSQIQISDVVEYLRLEPGQYQENELYVMMDAAKSYLKSYTGLTDEKIDEHDDFSIAFYVLVQEMFENRTMYVEKGSVNLVLDSILGMHRVNFLPGVDV